MLSGWIFGQLEAENGARWPWVQSIPVDCECGWEGWRVHIVCPTGCEHIFAHGPSPGEALELARHRLEVSGRGGELVICTQWHAANREEFENEQAEALAHFRKFAQ